MPPQLKISERHQVLLILAFSIVALAMAGWFLLWPQFKERKDAAIARETLKKSQYANDSVERLENLASREKANAGALNADWEAARRRLTSIPARPSPPSHIEYQVEYEAVKKQLTNKARTRNIALPAGLDINPAVTSSEILRERLNQLKTVEKLVDLVIDNRIIGISSIKTLPPVRHHGADLAPICEEYPVEVAFTTEFESLFYLFSSIFEDDRVFVFGKIRVTSDPREDEILHIKAVMSSLIFQ